MQSHVGADDVARMQGMMRMACVHRAFLRRDPAQPRPSCEAVGSGRHHRRRHCRRTRHRWQAAAHGAAVRRVLFVDTGGSRAPEGQGRPLPPCLEPGTPAVAARHRVQHRQLSAPTARATGVRRRAGFFCPSERDDEGALCAGTPATTSAAFDSGTARGEGRRVATVAFSRPPACVDDHFLP